MEFQIKEVISFVREQRESGKSISSVLKVLGVSRSNYYRWLNTTAFGDLPREKKANARSITIPELQRIDILKEANPQLRHRQIQGLLQIEGKYLSASTVYKHLKSQGKVEFYERREAAWKEARYEAIGANVMWGADWTQLRIGGIRWYLLTLIDFFSRLIVHFEIIPTVNAGHIKNLYELGLAKCDIPLDWNIKPELRVDQGSPNTSRVTKDFFKDIKADLSFARVRRPTDNARTERFYRTIKQEEIYLVGDYLDLPTAKEVIGEYIKWYNEKRPHQALWNFTPWLVHETNDKTYMLQVLRELKKKTWEKRREYWNEAKKSLTVQNK